MDANSDVLSLLDDVRRALAAALEGGLVGLYVCGSLTGGDFDEHTSDIDTIAVTAAALDADRLAALTSAHLALVGEYAAWENRIEVVYVSCDALATRGAGAYPTAVISPGQPLQLLPESPDTDEWLLNWHALREHSITLCGPSPETLLAPISASQLQARVRKDLAEWPERVRRSTARHPGWQAYAILTVCRCACTVQTGRQVSKKAGAEWAKRVWPQQAAVIDRALIWRQEQQQTRHLPNEQSYPQTVAFVDLAAGQLSPR